MIFFTANSKGYNDSPKAIYEKIQLNKTLRNKYVYVWGVSELGAYNIPGEHIEVKQDTFRYFTYAMKSKYWVASVNIERGLSFKKKNTIFLNTWHGIAINLMGNLVKDRNDFNWEKTNYICYSNDNEIKIYEKTFKARASSMIPTGLPRNDCLYMTDKEMKNQRELLRNKFDIKKDKKIILYAPTWRDSTDFGSNYQLTPPIDWKKWEKQLGDEYIFFLRTHPYTTKLMNVEFNDFLRDFSQYPNINELLIIADILISDYSSIIYDYAVLEKPLLCFGYDYDEYKKKRGFYYDLNKELPYGVIRQDDQLLNIIKTIDYKEASKKVSNLKKKHVQYGGNATTDCIKILLGERI